MPELILHQIDRDRLADILKGKPQPEGMRPGAWLRLVRQSELDILEMDDLRALAEANPDVIDVLGLPSKAAKR